ncbi:alpha/beta hydrolase [Carbonactinospora thermoautotrophica]|uniref:alpha/beta fold hydrolase n=2 Tax=Carbonactinospora thermoautotrophica TaxID=1469144 RepID=UPI002270AFDA|nr:alpha/beta hydrolase [Carbonactinospora thermoautotrophica]MCX9191379.1 alpha/beta hydrolase [Carbonactinospora thermoautotrophica]
MTAPNPSEIYVDGPWRHRAVTANGSRFHVAELGEGPLVLFVHGFPEFWWAWRHQLVAVAEAGYRAVAMDLRGYGASDKPPRGYDALTLAADVTGLVRALGEASAVLVGHGEGAYVAWTAATRSPKIVRGLVAVSMPHPRRLRTALARDPAQLSLSGYVLGFQLPWVPERHLIRHGGALVERLMRTWAGPNWPDTPTAARYRRAIQIPGTAHCALEFHRWAVRSLLRPDGLRYAAQMRTPIQAPVLHLHGRLDGALLPRTAAGSGEYVDAPYTFRVLEGVGHFPHEEAPQTFTTELLNWLA